MSKQSQPMGGVRAARRLLVIFGLTILTPGLILGFFGVRALMQESRLANQQIERQLASAAAEAGRRLESELKSWREAAEEIAKGSTWPERVRHAVEESGAVVLVGSRERVQPEPRGQLLYRLSPDTIEDLHQAELSPLTIQAQSLELREKAYDRAASLYRESLKEVKASERVIPLNGLARTLKKAGRIDEAIQAYRTLEKTPPSTIGSLPSDLIAIYEIASMQTGADRAVTALNLYRGLVEGRWALDKTSFVFYEESTRGWLPRNDLAQRLLQKGKQKFALTHAAEDFVQQPRSLLPEDMGLGIVFSSSEPFAAIVLSDEFVRKRVVGETKTAGMELSLLGPDGQVIGGAGPDVAHPVSATYVLEDAALPLRLQVWPSDPAALYAGAQRQRNLYIGVVGIVIALLGFGSYFTVRTFRSELAIAQMKSDFVSTVSHEFRSPLAGINQLGEMLRDGRVPDEARRREYYEMIVTETQRLRRLVENLLDFARMEEGRKQFLFEPVEPTEWLREVTDDFQAQAAAAGFSIESRIPPGLPPIMADRETLTTAMRNLLDNAVKYSPNAKSVRVEAEADRNILRISVLDRGVGIRDEDRSRIFEKFYRGGGELARQIKGAGLGLKLVHHIVAAHGGTIDFQSKEGEGSTFTIRLNL